MEVEEEEEEGEAKVEAKEEDGGKIGATFAARKRTEKKLARRKNHEVEYLIVGSARKAHRN